MPVTKLPFLSSYLNLRENYIVNPVLSGPLDIVTYHVESVHPVTASKELSFTRIASQILSCGQVNWLEDSGGVIAPDLKHDVSERGKVNTQYGHDFIGMLVEGP
jgi:hypothetical protein